MNSRGSGSSRRSACETPVSSMITRHRFRGAPSGTSDEARPGGSRTACSTSSVTAACTPLSMTCCGGPPPSSDLSSHHSCRACRQPGTLKNGSAIANGYGMGLSQGTYRGVRTVSHSGALAGYRTNFVRLPGEKLTVVTLCNNATANVARLTQMVAELYAPAGMSAPAAATGAPTAAPPQAPTQTRHSTRIQSGSGRCVLQRGARGNLSHRRRVRCGDSRNGKQRAGRPQVHRA